jgi:hypothetical protein
MNSILTVTAAASSFDLTTLTNVKAELDITNGASDAVLKRYISGASQAAAQHCNRVFAAETVSEQFLPVRVACLIRSNIDPLQLARWPLIAVTAVVEGDDPLTLTDDYLVDPKNGQLTRVNDSGFSRTWPNLPLTVAYSAGYTTATVPADLEDAVIRMVTKRYSAKGRDAALKSENIPGVRDVTYWIATGNEAGNMTPDVVDILENYRVPVLA